MNEQEWKGGLGRKAKYVYVGAHHLPTGIGQAAREHLKALVRAGLPICGKDPSLRNLSFFLRKELVAQDHVINELTDDRPDYHGPFEGAILHSTGDTLSRLDFPTLAYVVWEVQGLPDGWVDRMNLMDAVFTASEFTKTLFINGGVTKPIHTVPHPIDVMLFNPDVKPITPVDGQKPETVFLLVAQWGPRKGIEDVITAYLTEFSDNESVVLLLFAWGGSHSSKERMNIRGRIKSIRDGLNIPNQPKIWFIGQNLQPHVIPEVYALADVHISGSRGESFLLPAFESAAMAKPTIATGWSGMWDYLDESSAYPVKYELEPVHGVGGMWKFYNGTQIWARPSILSLREQMRRAHENKDERREKGQRALELVMEKMTHEIVGEQMKEIFLKYVGG